MKFYFKFSDCLLPSYFTSWNFSTHADIHRYNTRKKNTLLGIKTRTKLAEKLDSEFLKLSTLLI